MTNKDHRIHKNTAYISINMMYSYILYKRRRYFIIRTLDSHFSWAMTTADCRKLNVYFIYCNLPPVFIFVTIYIYNSKITVCTPGVQFVHTAWKVNFQVSVLFQLLQNLIHTYSIGHQFLQHTLQFNFLRFLRFRSIELSLLLFQLSKLFFHSWLAAYLTGFPPVGLHTLSRAHYLTPCVFSVYCSKENSYKYTNYYSKYANNNTCNSHIIRTFSQ